ncbi:MAG: hypothetical protein H5T60_03930 [Anaerolineae bacterium]|nr:hypothetical protein [Anaerolineae bacterium]
MAQLFDPRRHRAQTERRLITAGILILFVIGGGLIYAFYGGGAWLSGMLCMGAGVLLLLLLWGVLTLLDRLSRDHDGA